MAKSMTGYGRAEEILHGRNISVEIKSVNSRYFEYSSRLPRNFNFLDDALKKQVSANVSRGKVDLHLSVQNVEGGDIEVVPDLAVASSYYAALGQVARTLELENDVTASVMARFSDIFTVTRTEIDEEMLRGDVLGVAKEAMERHGEMREAEGEKLRADILDRLMVIENLLREVEADSEGRVQRYTQRLLERLQEVLEDTTIDEARILTEAAIFADKTAIAEETVRLQSHLDQFAQIVNTPGPIGRKLDFLTQEVNREVNTIGSKCQDIDITRLVVDMKAEVEKIREQLQNLE